MAGKGKLSTIYLTPLTRDKLSETDIGAFVIGLLNFSEIVLEKWEEGEGGRVCLRQKMVKEMVTKIDMRKRNEGRKRGKKDWGGGGGGLTFDIVLNAKCKSIGLDE